jgi:ribosomal-protein-alanine N-acetyltransferase
MIILETERLTFRHLVSCDLDELYRLYRDPEIRRYYPEGTLTYEETRQELEWFLHGHPQHPELGLWATLLKPDGKFIGRCGLLPWVIDGQYEVEVAYMIAKEYWGQGLGTEAALGIRDYAFNRLGFSRLVCVIEEDHIASIRVAEKIGMKFERHEVDDKGPFLLYSIEREG